MSVPKLRRLSVLFTLIMLIGGHCLAANELKIDGTLTGQHDLAPYVSYYQDEQSSIKIEDILQGKLDKSWQKLSSSDINFGYSDSSFWLKLNIHAGVTQQDLLISSSYPVINVLDFFLVEEGGIIASHRSGTVIPFVDRLIPHRYFLFPLAVEQGKQYQLYIRTQSESSVQLPLTLWHQQDFRQFNSKSLLALGLFFGCMLVMGFYNIFIFVMVRDVVYVYYFFYVLSLSTFLCLLNGLAYQYFWPGAVPWSPKTIAVTLSLALVFGAIFLKRFLGLYGNFPRLNVMVGGYAAMCLLVSLMAFWIPYSVSIKPIIFLSGFGAVLMFYVSVYCWRRGVTQAKFIVIAWSVFLFGVLVICLNKFHILPRNSITEHSMQIGSMLEVILISLALGQRINLEKQSRITAEQEAVKTLQNYRRLFENAIEGFYRIDYRAGRFVSANPSMVKLLGYTSETELLEDLDVASDLFASSESLRTYINTVREADTLPDFEAQIKRRDGSCFDASISSRASSDPNGNVIIEGSIIDITERKEKERAQAKQHQAEQQKEIAEGTAKAKSDFLATMSHEIRTPLNGMLGMAQLLQDSQLDENQQQNLATLLNSGESLLSIINDILDYSKIEAGKMDIESIPFDPKALIDECTSIFSFISTESNVPLYTFVDAQLPPIVLGDPSRIKQIVINLLSNAFKFTESGYVILNLSVMEDTARKTLQLKFEVQDTGIGLTAEEQGRLFKSFSQAETGTSRKYGGTGLGLAISKRLCELMGGTIGLSSQKHQGTTFWFTVTPGEHAERLVEQRAPEMHGLKGRRVAVLTDQTVLVASLQEYLGHWGLASCAYDSRSFSVVAVSEGSDKPDVLLVDHGLLNPSQQSQLQANGIRLILMATIKELAKSSEGIDYDAKLEKPFANNKLKRALQQALGLVSRQDVQHSSHQQFPHLRVLVAEDNRVNQLVILGFLKKLSIHPDVVDNGMLAVDAVKQAQVPYDVVLMDCEMPELDGYGATEQIRKITDERAKVLIVALSAHAVQEFRDRAFAVGMNEYLTKPVGQSDLEALFNRHFPVHSQAV